MWEFWKRLFGYEQPVKTGLAEDLAHARQRNHEAACRLQSIIMSDPLVMSVRAVSREAQQ